MMETRSALVLSRFFVFGLVAWLAYANYLIQDDGFISLTYAQNWAAGFGPVWYPRIHEFGYTNFLYVALTAALSWAGLSPLHAAGVVGYSAFAGSVFLVYRLVKKLTNAEFAALGCVLLIFSNYIVSTFAHGLLECSLQIFWVIATCNLAFDYSVRRSWLLATAIALAASLGVLTRLDTVLLVLPISIYLLLLKPPLRHLAIFVAIPLIVIGSYLAWCQYFYGAIMPNTFLVKGRELRIPYGFWYLHSFLGNELYIYVIAALCVGFVAFYRKPDMRERAILDPRVLCLLSSAALWILYIIYVGGDFISFRFLIPFITLFFIAVSVILSRNNARYILGGLVAFSFIVATSHWFIDTQNSHFYSRGGGIDSPQSLRRYVSRPEIGWQHTGEVLGRLFYSGGSADPRIAVIAAGALPFKSRLHAIDMLGLNDRWVAEHGDRLSNRPGHFKIAPREYLERRGVNLIIGPHFACDNGSAPVREGLSERYGNFPIILVPVSENCRMTALYMKRHPKIDMQIAKGAISLQENPAGSE